MNIAFFQRDLPPEKHGGVAKQVHLLANELVRLSQTVTVFSLSEKPDSALYEVRPCPMPPSLRSIRLTERFLLGWYFSRIPLHGFDIVHAHGDNFFMFGKGPQVRTYYGSALGEALHARNPLRALEQSLFWLGELAGLAAADVRVSISPGTKKYLPYIGHIVPCGVDLLAYRPANEKNPGPAILFVGSAQGRKRGQAMAAVYQRIRQQAPDAVLWTVGAGFEEGAGIHCFKNIDEDTLITLYQKAWVLCSLSTYEGFGLPLAEAMACGTPVVSTPNTGASFVLENGKNGIICGLERISDTVCGLLKDKTARDALAQAGGTRAQAFDIRTIAARYLELYHELIV
ncbi:MAG: hypothetical protein A2268_14875 [Candidatus Raymondbacteria bacterium RifOxyA12_full_50_37]|uniref:Glycosyl transferase family 1 domain-containing protein n=1 Tax=Candidatus Raymondbacteria bacterium RIFOXYD12_FULL_49_13 TaxID=1817890 RepID=A0A1F7F2H8_UNCRA|nr:MAG: hypothetical protein A2268_14875 [Candidatus Raymondbacteria bacterium RifOxyA12_full_50_37]OGJ87844.1 MAG: hypothetical protein A2350_12820 [Candidatus Raymondbacteria bacterium RifOxyB12_full_50_8]OGJ88698.1 MAG: hypothetical protein A2248_20810 [Candidatus Raymondbacteria bacterium RIFOXYA2_FULL_49_16]OGK00870.1 MAG: hypothetical protein A2519_08065 [Candidatus Raymondbacteria bacterium RIFOXYD12_FULL_49_13]OGK07497.1 MAG: hypothetical protein A2487_19980 [Candidatus Raymondbacteria 